MGSRRKNSLRVLGCSVFFVELTKITENSNRLENCGYLFEEKKMLQLREYLLYLFSMLRQYQSYLFIVSFKPIHYAGNIRMNIPL